VGHPSLASEFPNDNAEISGGGIWVCAALTGPATLDVVPYEPVPNERFVLFYDDDDFVAGPIELEITSNGLSVALRSASVEPVVAKSESEPESEPRLEPDDEAPVLLPQPEVAPAFAHFEAALAAILMTHGASRSAALLPQLLRLDALPADGFAKDVQLTLQSRGYLDGSARYSQKYRELWGAWTAVLHGSSRDFAACGTTTLDRFGAELLAALLAIPATRADELRRELRKAGVAAFGVLAAAA
jgi:hypothetical protein